MELTEYRRQIEQFLDSGAVAKTGETIGTGHLRALQQARAGLGTRAADAKLLLFGRAFTAELESEAAGRADIELVDLARLYGGS